MNARPLSPGALSRQATSAAEIDNEDLREQVQHFQKRISALEDDLEEARAAVEREEAAGEERARRVVEKEETTRKELAEARDEVEALRNAEAKAKDRVAASQEAVRENGAALENARAEIEGLRAELAVRLHHWPCFRCGNILNELYRIFKALPPMANPVPRRWHSARPPRGPVMRRSFRSLGACSRKPGLSKET